MRIVIDRKIEKYADVIDAAREYKATYGTAANALAQMVRQSPMYREWARRRRKRSK